MKLDSGISSVLSGFYRIVEETVENYDGFKPEFIADEFVTFFDNIEDAVSFCFEVRRRLSRFLKVYDLGVGLGVSSGVVLGGLFGGSTSKKYTYIGRVVNLASRLQSVALSGEILLDSSSYKAIESKVGLVSMRKYSLKGLNGNILIYSIKEQDFDKSLIQIKWYKRLVKSIFAIFNIEL